MKLKVGRVKRVAVWLAVACLGLAAVWLSLAWLGLLPWPFSTSLRLRATLKHHEKLSEVMFSPDGKTLASVGEKTIKLWDIATGKELWDVTPRKELATLRNYHVEFSPDGKTLATMNFVDDTVILWDVTTGKELATFNGIMFSPDGKTLATRNPEDNTIMLCGVAKGKQLATFKGGTVKFSPDGKTLALGRFRFLPLLEASTTLGLLGGRGQWYFLAASALIHGRDSLRGFYCFRESTFKLWDVAIGKELVTLKDQSCLLNELDETSAYFSPDGKTLATVVSPNQTSAYFSPDGKTLEVPLNEDPQGIRKIKLWEVATGKELAWIKGTRMGVFSSDGKMLATLNRVMPLKGNLDAIKLWDVATGKELATLKGHIKGVDLRLEFSPDGKTLASGSRDNTIVLWDVARGEEKTTLKGQRYLAFIPGCKGYLAFSPDGKMLVSEARDLTKWNSGVGTINLWDVATGKELATLTLNGSIRNVKFSPDGKTLVSVEYDGTIKLWDIP